MRVTIHPDPPDDAALVGRAGELAARLSRPAQHPLAQLMTVGQQVIMTALMQAAAALIKRVIFRRIAPIVNVTQRYSSSVRCCALSASGVGLGACCSR